MLHLRKLLHALIVRTHANIRDLRNALPNLKNLVRVKVPDQAVDEFEPVVEQVGVGVALFTRPQPLEQVLHPLQRLLDMSEIALLDKYLRQHDRLRLHLIQLDVMVGVQRDAHALVRRLVLVNHQCKDAPIEDE